MRALILRALVSAFSIQLERTHERGLTCAWKKAYMGVEDLYFTEYGMGKDDACGSLADKPVTGADVKRGAIQGVGV